MQEVNKFSFQLIVMGKQQIFFFFSVPKFSACYFQLVINGTKYNWQFRLSLQIINVLFFSINVTESFPSQLMMKLVCMAYIRFTTTFQLQTLQCQGTHIFKARIFICKVRKYKFMVRIYSFHHKIWLAITNIADKHWPSAMQVRRNCFRSWRW